MEETQVFTVYILYTSSYDKYYIGQTGNLDKRLSTHNSDQGNRYTSRFRPWDLALSIQYDSRSKAMLVEKYIKKRKSRRFITYLIRHPNPKTFLDKKLDLGKPL